MNTAADDFDTACGGRDDITDVATVRVCGRPRTRLCILAGAEMHLLRRSDCSPIWDLRRGDADDNRTSPIGRGWRNLAIATLLEFNYLSASIAFALLIGIPALVVGLVPPILVAYAGQHIESAALITSHPVASIAWLVVLIALAYWFGKPVASATVDSFWHLHHTLVFPLFVALRELISAGAERLPAKAITADVLFRRRRFGTLLATILLAGAAAALAAAVTFSGVNGYISTRGIDARALAIVGARNAVFVLAVSTVAASLFWFWHEIRSDGPVRDWTSGPPPAAPTNAVRIAHLSDLHVVSGPYAFRMHTGTSGPRGNGRVRRALRQLEAIHAATPLDRVLVTGDITDAGTRDEWVEFFDLLRRSPELQSRVLFLPGNHDVNIVDRTNTGRFDIPWSSGHALRRLRVVLALDTVQGRAVHVMNRRSGEVGPTLHDYLRQNDRPAKLRALAEHGAFSGRHEIAVVWDEIFPLIAPPPEDGGYGVILLDTNARRYVSLTNAIGIVGRSQLGALKQILRKTPPRGWLILLHHHLVEYPIRSIGLDERIGVVLINAPDVLKVIASSGSRVIVLHGHRHRDWIGRSGNVVMCSAASVAFGSRGATDVRHGSFYVYDLALDTAGGVQLLASERVLVA
jgi:3',5'-cyclic AMP phosphodiesterase CpdA